MGCSAIMGAAIPGFFLSSWFGMLLWGVIAPKFGVVTISYVDSMLITISVWIVVAPLAAGAFLQVFVAASKDDNLFAIFVFNEVFLVNH